MVFRFNEPLGFVCLFVSVQEVSKESQELMRKALEEVTKLYLQLFVTRKFLPILVFTF